MRLLPGIQGERGVPLCDSLGNVRYSLSGYPVLFAVRDRAGVIITTPLGLIPVYGSSRGDAAILVPVPHRPRFSLVFCCTKLPNSARNKGVEVSVLDGRLRGGLGDLVQHPDSLRVLLLPASWDEESPPLTVVRHANGRDLWVVTARVGIGFCAFLVTPAGLVRQPVVSQVGAFMQQRLGQRVAGGYLQFAANQRTAVLLSYGENKRRDTLTGAEYAAITLERFSFDPATGIFTAAALLYIGPGFSSNGTFEHQSLGIAPNGERLYVDEPATAAGRPDSGIGTALVQYDLRAVDSIGFRASRAEVFRRVNLPTYTGYYGILSGLDGKVYCLQTVRSDTTGNGRASAFVDVVDRPSAPANRCGFRPDVLTLLPLGQQADIFGQRRFHLPLAYNDVLPTLRTAPPVCPGDTTRFTLSQPGAVDSVRWHYADGSGVVDTGFVAAHVFPGAGTWRVTATYRYNGYAVDSLVRTVVVAPAPPNRLLATPADSVLCEEANGRLADALTLRALPGLPTGVRLAWSGPATTPADTLATLAVRQPGRYTLIARLGRCASVDSVRIGVAPCGVPNILTPNADGRNDALPLDLPGDWTLEVFDRWGRRRWASGAGAYRSGEWGGQGGAAGTYYYLLTRPADGRQLKGWVEVVK